PPLDTRSLHDALPISAWTAPEELVEEVLERGIFREGARHRRRPPGARDLHGPDVDDGGPDALGDAHERRLERVRALDGHCDGLGDRKSTRLNSSHLGI